MPGEKDTLTKSFMENPEVFADAFNFFVYGGRQVINPHDLRPLDTTAMAAPYGSDDAAVPVQKVRDVFKSWAVKRDSEAAYLLLGVENQSDIHYAMPVRNMVYDALQYSAQADEAAKSHRKDKNRPRVTSGEYLSGFYKTDKLIPVITLVIYFGDNDWDGPMSLHEMMSVTNREILQFVADYKINLIAPAALTGDDAEKFASDLKEVLFFIKYSKDKEQLQRLVKTDPKFSAINRETANVIKAMTGSAIAINQNEEVVDMCKAIEDIRLDGIEQGLERGLEQGINGTVNILSAIHMPKDEMIDRIADTFRLSKEEAERYVTAYDQ